MTLSNPFKQSGFALFSIAVIGAATASCFYPSVLPPFAGKLFSAIAFGASAVFALYFRRLNVLFLILFLGSFSFLLTDDFAAGFFAAGGIEMIRAAAWYLLPINFVIFAFLEERSAISFGSFLRFMAIVVQIFAVVWLAKSGDAQAVTNFLSSPPIGGEDAIFNEPQIIQLALSFAAIVTMCALISLSAHKTINTALLFAFVSSLAALFFHPLLVISNAYFSAAAFIVSMGFVHFAYRLAFYDELTGVLCRRALNDDLARLEGAYAIAMIDIDHFKRFNDEHGHDTGDQALKMVSSRLAATRGHSAAYRYGGEEFVLIFEGKNRHEAAPFLEDTRSLVEATPFMKRTPRPKEKKKPGGRIKLSKSLHITISIGAADSADGGSPDDVLQRADRALYKAKDEGRNRLVLA